jgi:hypothetical protein
VCSNLTLSDTLAHQLISRLAETGLNRSMLKKTDGQVYSGSNLYRLTDYSISNEEVLSWGTVGGTRYHGAPETEEAGGGTLCNCRLTSAH